MVTFEGYERRINQIMPVLEKYGIKDLEEAREICKENGYRLLDLPVNLGLAGGFQAGMKYAYRAGYDYAIQFDADGQHIAKEAIKLLEEMDRSNVDIVIGILSALCHPIYVVKSP